MFSRTTQTVGSRRLPPIGPFNTVAVAPSPMPPDRGPNRKLAIFKTLLGIGITLLEIRASRGARLLRKR